MTLDQAVQENWDYIIIGTGMGGSTLGWSLANKGKKVLFLEKGMSKNLIKGEFPESKLQNFEQPTSEDLEILKQHGRYSEKVVDESFTPSRSFIPLLGQGAGGSSLLYGAALERFFPEDFTPEKFFADQKEASLANWPISYADLETYYTQAEELYQVYGGVDPLRVNFQNKNLLNVEYTTQGKALVDYLNQQNLHPYRLPVGHKPRTSTFCKGCQAIVCVCDNKSDAAQIALFPAIKEGKSYLIDNCEVLRLISDAEKVKGVEVLKNLEKVQLKAKTIILAAGVLNTTKILLNSKNDKWPLGLGNHSGLVGKNFCRHYMDLIMVDLPPATAEGCFEKEIAFNDFYFYEGGKLGTIQSLGNPPSIKTVLYEMYSEMGQSQKWRERFFYQFAKYCGKPIMNSLFNKKLCLATIMEDVSYASNQIFLNSSGEVSLRYQIHEYDRKRISQFRELGKNSLKKLNPQIHPQAENNQRLAHASGTCRMGTDRRKSVVDQNNKVHDLENLYIVDASFFPSSTGINPALTIAANALRVAEVL